MLYVLIYLVRVKCVNRSGPESYSELEYSQLAVSMAVQLGWLKPMESLSAT